MQMADLLSATERMTLKGLSGCVNKSSNGVTVSQTKENNLKYVIHSNDKSTNVPDIHRSDVDTYSNGSQSIQEVYERQARKYPDIYKKQLSSNDNKACGVKRGFEDCDGFLEKLENSLEHKYKESIDKGCDSALDDSSKSGCVQKKSQDTKTSTCRSKTTLKISASSKKENNPKQVRHRQPILKGILEGNLTLDDFLRTDKNLFVPSLKDNDSRSNIKSSGESSVCDAASSADEISLHSEPDFAAGASGELILQLS